MYSNLSSILRSYVLPFTGFAVFLSVVVVAYKLIVTANKPRERTKVLETIPGIIIGAFILGSIFLIGDILIVNANHLLASTNSSVNLPNAVNLNQDEGNWITKLIASGLDELSKGLSSLMNTLFGVSNIGELLNAKSSKWFPSNMQYAMIYLMVAISLGVFPAICIAIAKTGFQYTLSPLNPVYRLEAKEGVLRWFLSLVLIVLAIPFFIALLQLNDALGTMFNGINAGSVSNTLALDAGTVKTGSVLLTSIVNLVFSVMSFYIAMLFKVRVIMVVVFFAFTGIAAVAWAINKNVNAAGIWFGEIISNILMPSFYLFVFTVFSFIAAMGPLTWLDIIIWLFMILTLAETLRNSLQGLYTKLSGVNEASMPGKVAGGVIKAVGAAGAFKAAKTTFSSLPTPKNFTASLPSGNVSHTNSNLNTSQYPSSSSNGLTGAMLAGSNAFAGYGDSGKTGSSGYMGNSDNSGYGGNSGGGMRVPNQQAQTLARNQGSMAWGMAASNKASNIVSGIARVATMPIAMAAAPLGENAVRAVAGMGNGFAKVVGGSVRAIGTTASIGAAARKMSNQNNMSFRSGFKELMNVSSEVTVKGFAGFKQNMSQYISAGANAKNIISSNIRNDDKSLEGYLRAISPVTDNSSLRWHYKPSSDDFDNFRWSDKAISNAQI